MKKVMYFLVSAAMILAVSSCGGGSSSPSSIEKSIYSQFQKGNYEKGIEIYFDNISGDDDAGKPKSADETKEAVKAFAGKVKQSIDAKGGIKKFEIVEEKIAEDGKTATVASKITYGDGSGDEQSTKYVKQDGKWKIVFGK
ncbi:MAG: DUF4878 domain-containing protein [Tannerella sp.]|jgi:hypothetical protein|nr:DUF4878 domain-containing protein [Tannerella sp.]